MGAECMAAVYMSGLPDGSLQAGGRDIRHQTKHVAEGREGDDGEESGGRDEERKEVSVFQLLVFLSSQTSGSRMCEDMTVFFLICSMR